MKKILLIAAALSLSGCGAIAAQALEGLVDPGKPAAVYGDKVVIEATRAMIWAHNAYQLTANLAAVAIRNGKLTPGQVDAIEAANKEALRYLDMGQTGLTYADRVAGLLNVVNRINVILGR